MIPNADNRMMEAPQCPRCIGMKSGVCPHCGRVAGRRVYFDVVVQLEEPHAVDGSALRPHAHARMTARKR